MGQCAHRFVYHITVCTIAMGLNYHAERVCLAVSETPRHSHDTINGVKVVSIHEMSVRTWT